jgi:hypothetical protein
MFYVKFEVMMALDMTNTVFWDVTSCSLAKSCQLLGGKCCLYFQGEKGNLEGEMVSDTTADLMLHVTVTAKARRLVNPRFYR